MQVGLLVLEFRLVGCHSLKEKRHRLRGLRDRFGKIPNLAVAESDYQDKHGQAQWSFVALGETKAHCEKLLASVGDYSASELDAVLSLSRLEWL